jgi:hypothetical protein
MTIDDFFKLVRILANQSWVRYYLLLIPGQLVLELALPRGASAPDQLNRELADRGFVSLSTQQTIPEIKIYRWSIARIDAP